MGAASLFAVPYLPMPKSRYLPTMISQKKISQPSSLAPDDGLTGSVTRWIHQIRESNNSEAQQELWNRYFHRLAGIARTRLPVHNRRVADEEDVALSVLNSFFVGALKGRYPRVSDRTQLWPLLAKMAEFKANKRSLRERAQKRGGGCTIHPVSADASDSAETFAGDIVESGPTPQAAVELKDLLRHLMEKLDCDTLRTIALMKLQGHLNTEIAAKLQVATRTVERKLLRIRTIWMSAQKIN